jgi:hypothetical protein
MRGSVDQLPARACVVSRRAPPFSFSTSAYTSSGPRPTPTRQCVPPHRSAGIAGDLGHVSPPSVDLSVQSRGRLATQARRIRPPTVAYSTFGFVR